MLQILLENEAKTQKLAKQIAVKCPNQGFIIYLTGDLGTGKTTFTRGFLRAIGYQGHVKSPTYPLVESYWIDERQVCHFDLYRLADPEELDYIGLEDYVLETNICLIEWPEKGYGRLPKPDLRLHFSYLDAARQVEVQGDNHLIEFLRAAMK